MNNLHITRNVKHYYDNSLNFLLRVTNLQRLYLLLIWLQSFAIIYIAVFLNFLFKLIIRLPDCVLPNIENGTPIKIIYATDKEGRSIKNKLNLYLRYKWDYEMFHNGGVNIDQFIKCINTEIISIAYISDNKIKCVCSNFINVIDKIKSDKTGYGNNVVPNNNLIDNFIQDTVQFKKNINLIVINSNAKLLYRFKDETEKDSEKIVGENYLFGEINF